MGDLIINFDDKPQDSGIVRTNPITTSGSWTQKLKQKRQAKDFQNRLKATSQNPVGVTIVKSNDESALKVNNDKENCRPQKFKDGEVEDLKESENGPGSARKKPRLSQNLESKPTPRFQIISSLFSSTIIPTIKPSETNEGSNLIVCAPSNACLSEINISSASLNLHPQISNHLSTHPKMGFKSPTRIQSIAWPLLTSQSSDLARDVIIQSQTGSGKTLAYLVPIIQDLLTLASQNQTENWNREIGTLAIILLPTRELAEQVHGVATKLLGFARRTKTDSNDEEGVQSNEEADHSSKIPPGDGLNPRWLVPGTLHGGTNRTHEKARLRKGLPLLICTPGRLLDHLEKTTSLRIAGEPASESHKSSGKKPGNQQEKASRAVPNSSNLGLRWLVVDEADRLMDMGFEEQMRGILKHLADRKSKSSFQRQSERSTESFRKTVLCSATMPDGVKKLVGLTLKDPIVLKTDDNNPTPKETQKGGERDEVSNEKSSFSAPSQLSQKYVVTPPKLRLVSLIALLRQITDQKQKSRAEKVLVFMSCTASVDFHFEALSGVSVGKSKQVDNQEDQKDDKKKDVIKKGMVDPSTIMKKSSLLPGVKLFRLHGNLDLPTRLASLNGFSRSSDTKETNSSSSSVLFCTSLAGRGLDVPFVSHVIQYDLPTEGGVTEYLHRIGRTARAGKTGEAWSLILPSEEGWVKWCENNQKTGEEIKKNELSQSKKLKQIELSKVLKDGFGGKTQKDWEVRATDVQMAIERWVIESTENTKLASLGFGSHIRAYTTHPSDEKVYFHIKNLHLGHLAKSFGLRDSPNQLTGYSSGSNLKTNNNFNNPLPSKNNRKERRKNMNDNNKRKRIDGDDENENDGSSEDDGTKIKKSFNSDEDEMEEEYDYKKFEVLNQFNNSSNRNPGSGINKRLKGPISNGIDEFNVL